MVQIPWAPSGEIVGAYWAHRGPIDFTAMRFGNIVGAYWAHSGHLVSHRFPPPARLRHIVGAYWAHASTVPAHRFHSAMVCGIAFHIVGAYWSHSGRTIGHTVGPSVLERSIDNVTYWAQTGRIVDTSRSHCGPTALSPEKVAPEWVHSGRILGAYLAHCGPIGFSPRGFESILGASWVHGGRMVAPNWVDTRHINLSTE